MYQSSREKILLLLHKNLYLSAAQLNSVIGKPYPFIKLVRLGVVGCSIYNDKRYYYLPDNFEKLPLGLRTQSIRQTVAQTVIKLSKTDTIKLTRYRQVDNIEYPVFEHWGKLQIAIQFKKKKIQRLPKFICTPKNSRKEREREYRQKYREEHREYFRQYNKKYDFKTWHKKHYAENRDRILQQQRERLAANPEAREKKLQYMREYSRKRRSEQ